MFASIVISLHTISLILTQTCGSGGTVHAQRDKTCTTKCNTERNQNQKGVWSRVMQLINKDKWRLCKLQNYFSVWPLNVQLGGGTSFSNPLNRCCNYLLLLRVCVCVWLGADRNVSAAEAYERLMLSSHAAASERSLLLLLLNVEGKHLCNFTQFMSAVVQDDVLIGESKSHTSDGHPNPEESLIKAL